MKPLDPQLVLGAYAAGVFPMADARGAAEVYWIEPKQRAVLPIEAFRPSRSLSKTLRSDRFRVTADTAFAQVLQLCAESAVDRPETWINHDIESVFVALHRMGFAHSIECWDGDALVGGLYGLALGRAFFGESMVSRATDASKVALAWLVARLKAGGFTLLDCQFQTDHLASMGAMEIDRADYMVLLSGALSGVLGASSAPASASGDFFALDRGGASDNETLSGPLSGKAIAQLFTHTS